MSTAARPGAAARVLVERVVAALDDSELTEAVAQVAAAEAGRRVVPLEFVRVVDDRHSWRDARHDPVLRRGLLALPPRTQPTPRLRLSSGWPADALIRGSAPTDLLVVGAGRVRGTFGTLVGSTCVRILRHAGCPVLVVPTAAAGQPERRPWPVVAAVGLDDDQDAVIATALDEAADRGVQLRIVHSCRPADFTTVFGAGAPVAWADLETHAHLAINEVIRRENARHPEVRITVSVAATAPTDLMTRSTRKASLLVVGHRRHDDVVSPPRHLTRAVLRHTAACVLSVPVGVQRTLQPTS